MRQETFERDYASTWQQLGWLLEQLERRQKTSDSGAAVLSELPALYRAVCSHYALAVSRRYSPALLTQLHHLVLRGHRQLYRPRGAALSGMIAFLGAGFPRAVRENARYLWLALALSFGPGLVVGGYCYHSPDLIYSILDQEQVANLDDMYDPHSRRPGRSTGRDSESDFVMFGIYISNNIGIGFRVFAGGVLFGVGTVLLLLYNGVTIGGVAGHLTQLGYHGTFWPFVFGHASFELTAIVICGAAGLMLGHALLAPGQQMRMESLKRASPVAVELVVGAALMLLLAAFVEAFWSASEMPSLAKFLVGALLWAGVLTYLGFAGRVPRGPR